MAQDRERPESFAPTQSDGGLDPACSNPIRTLVLAGCRAAALAVDQSGAVSALVAHLLDLPFGQVRGSFAPGRIEVMSAMTFSLGYDPAYAATCHILRLFLLIALLPLFLRPSQKIDAGRIIAHPADDAESPCLRPCGNGREGVSIRDRRACRFHDRKRPKSSSVFALRQSILAYLTALESVRTGVWIGDPLMPQIGHQTKERACLELVDRLAKLETIDAVRDSVLGILGDYGVDKLIVTHVPAGKDRLRPHVLLEHGWADWLAHYDRHRYFAHDPVGRYCFSTVEPFAWSEAPIDLNVQPLALKVMDEASAIGMQTGFSVPVVDLYGYHAVISMGGRAISIDAHERRLIQLLSYYIHGAAVRINRSRRDVPALSQREKEILTQYAAGHRSPQIAQALGINIETVSTHVKRARSKLKTETITQTVVEALRTKQISL